MILTYQVGRGGMGSVVVYNSDIDPRPIYANTIATFPGNLNQSLDIAILRAKLLISVLSESKSN
jgi:hypothetical protein